MRPERHATGGRWHRGWFGRRLYLRIYLAVIASLVVLALVVGGLWRWSVHDDDRPGAGELAVAIVGDLLPGEAGAAAWQQTLDRWHARTGVDLMLVDAAGVVLAAAGAPIDPAVWRRARRDGDQDDTRRARLQREGRGSVWVVPLPDGRRLAASGWWRLPGARPPWPGFAGSLVAVVLLIGLAVYPVVRRLTRRLEALQHAVEALGAGDLSARVPVVGRDEVAALAASFNRAAQRIEEGVGANRRLLANASHELRSPLARIRLAIELDPARASSATREELRRNIAELDALIDEILLASRLDAAPVADAGARERFERFDLAGLFAEEAARVGVGLEVDDPVPAGHEMRGDPRMVRRLLRNLLENAMRHGGDEAGVQARLAFDGREWVIEVLDRGPGVPEDERERIFEPFYRLRGASERAGGVGLGLALVRQIATHHGGSAGCDARAGGGARFHVRLPDGAAGHPTHDGSPER